MTNDTAKPAKKKVCYSIEWPGEAKHGLSNAWIDVFQPHMAEIAESLSHVIVKQFTHRALATYAVWAWQMSGMTL